MANEASSSAPEAKADVFDGPIGWPELWPEEIDVPAVTGKKPIVVYLDAGHGAKNNPGASSCFCVDEQDFTSSLAHDVEADLTALGGFKVVLSRPDAEMVQYAERVEAARRVGADAFVSLHSDIRGKPEEWRPDGQTVCRRSEEAPGFSVLYSDEGTPELVTARKRLADSIASTMLEASFAPYLGKEYVDLYEPIPSETGVFVDRHEDKKRIFILRRTVMPTVIVETHNALDPREALAFEDPIVRRNFSRALAKGIALALGR
ncbi:MAG: N-acetylmuramoyl-L-alanine amidase [Polyangiaceae bacterium]|nr:N-acetylmuramoyl-L-alanine amidase [Polyangiaceae bacterium]